MKRLRLLLCGLWCGWATVVGASTGPVVGRLELGKFEGKDPAWSSSGGEWKIASGRYEGRNADAGQNAFAQPRRAPLLEHQSAETTIAVRERLLKEGWSLGGIALVDDSENFWMLALTEDANGRRYVDFVENRNGLWQAQNAEGPTKLKPVDNDTNTKGTWEPNRDYRLTLRLSQSGIRAEVADSATNENIYRATYDFGAADAVRLGSVALMLRGAAASFDDVSVVVFPEMPVLSGVSSPKIESGKRGNIALLKDTLPGADLQTTVAVAKTLRAAGFGVTPLTAEQASDPLILNSQKFFLYAVPDAAVYPAQGAKTLSTYLRGGGNLLLLGGPPFSRPVWKQGNEWLDAATIKARIAQRPAENVFLDFDEKSDLSAWKRNSSDANTPASLTLDSGPNGQGKALKVSMENLSGWHTYASPELPSFARENQELVTFWAKGDARTPQLSIEANERDGSRWIAVVPLKTSWSYHVLAPEDFLYWKDSKTTRQRGGDGDRFNPREANRLVIGLASSHTPSAIGSGHDFWVAKFGAASNPFSGTVKPANFPTIETVYPGYKTYPLRNIASVSRLRDGMMAFDVRLNAPVSEGYSAIPRPEVAGVGARQKWRYKPLMYASDKNQHRRGFPAWITLNLAPPYADSAVAVVGLTKQSELRTAPILEVIQNAAERIADGIFLTEAGSQYRSHFMGEKINLGATVVNIGRNPANVRVNIDMAKDTNIIRPFVIGSRSEQTLTLAPGESRTVFPNFSLAAHDQIQKVWACISVSEAKDWGKCFDSATQRFDLLQPPSTPDEFIAVRGHEFIYKGKPWHPVGINYWPSYVSGMEPGDYNAGWLKPAYYDAAKVENDLRKMQALGINLVSIQTGGMESLRNLQDFLMRCRKHGIWVNAFINGAEPTNFREAEVAAYIKAGNLDKNATIFAYDTIWEPGNWMFNAANRPKFDGDWQKWIVNRYGSVENAEADWGMAAPRKDDKVTAPSDAQLSNDGAHRVMVAAYRRFMDDLMSAKWNDATRRLRRLVPNQLVSFRQGNTLPHDFALTAPVKHIDFICPEGYSIPPGAAGHDAAGFITRYAQFTTKGKPVIWSEFGQSVWDSTTGRPDQSAIAKTAAYHELFYKVALETGAAGTIPWWWPGGYRVNERSDFGIMNEDGTPRPMAELIKKYAPQLQAPRPLPVGDSVLAIDRDAHAGGYWHLAFNDGAKAYGAARKDGKNISLRTAGTGTDSSNVPLLAVGNTPLNGKNPPKYLNAEFNWLQAQNANGEWVEVKDGAALTLAPGQPLKLRVSVGNTQEARWLAQSGPEGGAVYLATTPDSTMQSSQALTSDVPQFGDADFGEFVLAPSIDSTQKITLQMHAAGRVWFGEKRSFTVRIKAQG